MRASCMLKIHVSASVRTHANILINAWVLHGPPLFPPPLPLSCAPIIALGVVRMLQVCKLSQQQNLAELYILRNRIATRMLIVHNYVHVIIKIQQHHCVMPDQQI